MLQYDLSHTQLFEATSHDRLPSEAEMFVLTVALLLLRDTAYSCIEHEVLQLTKEDVPLLAQCIEYRLTPLVYDFGDPEQLRVRLRQFVGLRIGPALSEFQTAKELIAASRSNDLQKGGA